MAPLQQDLGPEFEALELPEVLKKIDDAFRRGSWQQKLRNWLLRLRRYG